MKIWDRAFALIKNDTDSLVAFLRGPAWAFIETLATKLEEDELVALKPFAEQALADVVQDAGLLASPGGVSAAIASAIPQALSLLVKAGKAMETVAEHDLIMAIQAAAANMQAKVAGG